MVPGESIGDRFQRWYWYQPRAIRLFLTVNTVIYLVWVLVLAHINVTRELFLYHFALNPNFPEILFEPWQLLTYNFLHLGLGLGGFLHILFNMLWLYWIGRDFEEMHGPHEITAVYILAGIGGGLLALLRYLPVLGAPPIHGASASVIGVMCAVATYYPNRGIGLLFIGVIPLKYLVIGLLALDLIFGMGSNVAVSAHFGGAAVGYLFVRAEQRGIDCSSWAKVFFSGKSQSRASGLGGWMRSLLGGGGTAETGRSNASSTRPGANRGSINDAEVDRILDKISEQGYESLTEEEKRTLHEASKR